MNAHQHTAQLTGRLEAAKRKTGNEVEVKFLTDMLALAQEHENTGRSVYAEQAKLMREFYAR